MSNDNVILQIDNLQVQYETDAGVVKAVNGVSFSLKKGKTIGLVGETGAGKTTIALSIMGLLPTPPARVTEGRIQFDDKDLLKMKERERRKIRGKYISMIFQDPMTSLNPIERVGDQIMEVIRIHDKISRKEAQEKAVKMLEMVGIPGERFNEFPHQFSGGMKQRVVIAIALSCTPGLLIADEPTTALDVTIQAQVLEMMKGLKEKYEMSMLMITHDLGIVAEICDEVSVVYAGRVVEHGTLADVFDNTRHPYTEGLFNSLPNIENQAEKLKPIRGLMPDPTDLPLGCPFYPRCDHAMEICRTKKPPKVYRNETHFVECHLYNEQNIGDKEEKWR